MAPPKSTRTCSIDGCAQKHRAKGFCNKHYLQIKQRGKIFERTRFDPNPFIDKGNHFEIVLYNVAGVEAARALVDREDIVTVSGRKWYMRSDGYVVSSPNDGKPDIRLHRLVMGIEDDRIEVDHRSPKYEDRRDCRKQNLRIATHQQNSWNAGISRNNSSGRKGVHLHKDGKWIARITVNGRSIHLGYFTDLDAASAAYDAAAKHFFGVYAFTNSEIK